MTAAESRAASVRMLVQPAAPVQERLEGLAERHPIVGADTLVAALDRVLSTGW